MERLKIFYIDDDWDDLYLFEAASTDLPIDIHLFTEVPEMFSMLESGMLPDVLFIDLNMPRISGFEAIEMLKSIPAYSEIPVVVLSTSSNQPTVDRAKAAGASYYIQKPTSVSKLVKAVRHVLNISWKEHVPESNFLYVFD